MHIISEQLGRIKHFLVILIPLFAVNALFNLNYDWGGISVIARVYIMVLSFYIIFIFSQINVDEYRNSYSTRYGWKGKYYLFIVLRIFPFLFVYFLTIVFTLINYINTDKWPMEPVARLLDGRYSNTIIYALILFVVLKQKKRPEISVPLFIIFSIIYFGADKVLYSLFDPGIGVSIIKLTKYCVFIFILIYGYSKSRWKFAGSVVLSLFFGTLISAAVTSCFVISFYLSPIGSISFSNSAEILLKYGFVFPLDRLQLIITENGTSDETKNFFRYLDKYGRETNFTTAQWERLILKDEITSNENIFKHLNKRNIRLSFETIKNYAGSQLSTASSNSISIPQFTRYFGSFYSENKDEFFKLYKSGSEPMKIIILKALAYTNDIDAVLFLTDKLTGIERIKADISYNSLKKISGKDPAADLKKEKYDIDVILFFRNYASQMKQQ